jgi:transcriptional regulator with XRE-family HTH domain
MQRIRRSRPPGVRSSRPAHRIQHSTTPGASGVTATAGITTLAPAFGQALPSLDAIPTAYSHEFNAELVYDLCSVLVREGLGTPEMWQKCNENPIVFAQHAIMRGIGEERWNLLQRNVEYHLQVSDVAEREGFDTALENGQLAVTIECGGSGYLKIGPAIDALEEEAEGLGAAFYWILTHALYRVMRLYNHDDALQYEERMKEYAEEEEEGNKDQYEFPEVEKALPESIRKTLTHDDKRWILRARRLLSTYRHGRYRPWIERLRKIQQLSRLPLRQSRDFVQEGNYDSPPLPSLLVAFKEHDAITACFDEEGQYMLEGSSEPAVGVVFSPQKPDEVRHAMRIVAHFLVINHELFQLVEELQEWEKSHASSCLDRGEPQLRVA